MKKFLVNLLCTFIPSRKLRRKVRDYFKPRSKYKIKGSSNKIFIDGLECHDELPGLKVYLNGCNNVIKLNSKTKFMNTLINIDKSTENVNIEINTEEYIHSTHIGASHGKNQRCVIGYGTKINGVSIYLNDRDADVIIGKNCLFSSFIHIWPTDGHTILNKNTGEIINKLKSSIVIGDNCWIGQGVTILKDVCLPDNTVIGAQSVVTKSFDKKNTIIAGNPGKVIKHNVTWNVKNTNDYEKQTKRK